MRFALLAAASTLLVGFATLACSGTAAEDVGEADAGESTAVADQTSASASTPASGTGATTPVTDAGTVDATVTATTDGDAGAACTAGAIRESESNDTTANVVPATTGAFCGRLLPGDTDKVSFVMPATITSFGAGFDQLRGNGRMQVAADVNGQGFDFFGRWPFVPGGTYTITLTGKIPAGAELDYNVTFDFDQ